MGGDSSDEAKSQTAHYQAQYPSSDEHSYGRYTLFHWQTGRAQRTRCAAPAAAARLATGSLWASGCRVSLLGKAPHDESLVSHSPLAFTALAAG
eukprot:scaffold19217_cov117-Isochrysis_galbana.AAC.2